MSLNMLVETPGGFDYTGADCIGWLKEAGFREAYVEHLVGPDRWPSGSNECLGPATFAARRVELQVKL